MFKKEPVSSHLVRKLSRACQIY